MRDPLPILNHLIARNMRATGSAAHSPEASQFHLVASCAALQLDWVYNLLQKMSLDQNYLVLLEHGRKMALLPVANKEDLAGCFARALHRYASLLSPGVSDVTVARLVAGAYLSAWIQASTGKTVMVSLDFPPGESEYIRFVHATTFLEAFPLSTIKAMPICKVNRPGFRGGCLV